jgi:hypothetical protein
MSFWLAFWSFQFKFDEVETTFLTFYVALVETVKRVLESNADSTATHASMIQTGERVE